MDTSTNPQKPLSLKQQQFCQEYLKDLNGAQAALRAGYAKSSSRVTASKLLGDARVRTFINDILEGAGLGPEETKKLISDIARSSLNDYFTVQKVERRPLIVKSLRELANELQDEIDFEEEFALRADLVDEHLRDHISLQAARRQRLLRYEIELESNPLATRIVEGPAVLVDVPELDMAKLVADKELGRIKSITPGQYGTKVEMYSADTALTNLARIHGLFAPEKVDANVKASVHVSISKEDIELFKEAFNAKY